MGTAIAIEHAARSIPVVLMDKDPEALRRAAATAAVELAAAQRCGGASCRRSRLPTRWTTPTLAGCDLVLESIVEKRPAKQALFAHIRPHLADRAILATNTSTIPIARLASGPGRSRPVLRTAFLPSRPPAPVGRGDSRSGHKPGNRGSGRGPCQLARKAAPSRGRWPRFCRESSAADLSQRGPGNGHCGSADSANRRRDGRVRHAAWARWNFSTRSDWTPLFRVGLCWPRSSASGLRGASCW